MGSHNAAGAPNPVAVAGLVADEQQQARVEQIRNIETWASHFHSLPLGDDAR